MIRGDALGWKTDITRGPNVFRNLQTRPVAMTLENTLHHLFIRSQPPCHFPLRTTRLRGIKAPSLRLNFIRVTYGRVEGSKVPVINICNSNDGHVPGGLQS